MMTSEDIKRIMPDDLAMRRIKRAEKACREAQNDDWKNFDNHPTQVNTVPLIQCATDILDIPYEEVNYGIVHKIRNNTSIVKI